MTDEELIDVLRRMSPRLDMLDCESVLTAADRLEAQAAEIEKLEKACAEWAEVSQSNYQRAKAAEAKLAKALEAMQKAIRLALQPHYGDRGDALDHCFDGIDVLRTTLAELTGAKP